MEAGTCSYVLPGIETRKESHSMVTEVQCSYSTVSTEELMTKVIPDYQIESPVDCLLWEHGSNDTYIVRSAGSRYSLRIYRFDIYPRDEIDFEVDALIHLHKSGFPVAFPIPRMSGGYITELKAPEGLRYALLTAFVDGEPPEYNSVDDFRLCGESAARLHEKSEGFVSEHRKKNLDLKTLADDSLRTIEPFLSHRPQELASLKYYLESIRQSIREVGEDDMDIGFCHGDMHGYNAHLHEGVLTHFDFEECGFGYRLFDLATFRWGAVLGEEQQERWAAFVEGYESVRKISAADIELVDTFVLLRHIWLIAFHMRNAYDFGGELTSDQYIDRQWKRLKRFSSEGLGIELKKQDDTIVVVRVVDGGPAAISAQISENDNIVGVGEGENGEILETKNRSLGDVIDLIGGRKGTIVRLRISSGDATSGTPDRVVSLVRDKVKL